MQHFMTLSAQQGEVGKVLVADPDVRSVVDVKTLVPVARCAAPSKPLHHALA